MSLDPPELRILVASVSKAGDEHPLEDRIGAGKPGLGLFELLGFNTEFEQRLEHGGKEPHTLRMPDRLRREIVLHDNRGIHRGEIDLLDILKYPRHRLEHHPASVGSLERGELAYLLRIALAERHRDPPFYR